MSSELRKLRQAVQGQVSRIKMSHMLFSYINANTTKLVLHLSYLVCLD